MKRMPKKARPLWGRRSVARHFIMWRARGFEYAGDQRDLARARAEFCGVPVERVVHHEREKKTWPINTWMRTERKTG